MTQAITQYLSRSCATLIVFESRYGRGFIAALPENMRFGDLIESAYTGGDNEACAADEWFHQNPAYPAASGDTVENALGALNQKLCGFLPALESDRRDLEIEIREEYDRVGNQYPWHVPAELRAKLDQYRTTLQSLTGMAKA